MIDGDSSEYNFISEEIEKLNVAREKTNAKK